MHVLQKSSAYLGIGLVVLLSVSLISSLFFKDEWLWMDEVLSYLLISDPSLAHLNEAVVSGMDANPPVFANVYWFTGHTLSLQPHFLRAVSVLFFALAIGIFFVYLNTLVGTPVTNFVLVTLIVGLTYLNVHLATQLRAYALFLFFSSGYFLVLHRLLLQPDRVVWLVGHAGLGLLLVLTHNFGLFYLAASGALVGLCGLWSGRRAYLPAIGTHLLVGGGWLVVWYANFTVQAQAGQPHSWIPLPTLGTFFSTAGELVPTLSSTLERSPGFTFLPVLRFGLVLGLFAWIVWRKRPVSFRQVQTDPAFLFFLLAGFLYFAVLGIALVVTFAHTSVFLSRYLWPSHLLLIYLLVYAFYFFVPTRRLAFPAGLLPAYGVGLALFLFYQNQKLVAFPNRILAPISQLNPEYPLFVESADYFLPIWHHQQAPVHFLLDWKTATAEGNILEAPVEHHILASVKEMYDVSAIVAPEAFTPEQFPRFYIVDEASVYQSEYFIESGQIRVLRVIPTHIAGHRILECTF